MNAKQLLYALNDINDTYIEDAEIKNRRTQPDVLKALGILAACIALVLSLWGISTKLLSQPRTVPPANTNNNADLPMLAISEAMSGKGEASYFAYDISELTGTGTDWEFSLLPVFRNPLDYRDGSILHADRDQMLRLLKETAQRFGINESADMAIERPSDDTPGDETFSMRSEDYLIEVNSFSRVNVTLLNRHAASTLRLSPSADKKELQTVAAATIKQFASILAMSAPTIILPRGDYDVNGQQKWNRFFVYESSGNTTAGFLNVQFHAVEFFFDESGALAGLSWGVPDLTQCIGEYPLLTQQQAIAAACKAFDLNEQDILRAELFYHTESTDAFFVPCYRFYVQTDDTNIAASLPGMHTYTTYILPAVLPEYIRS